MLDPPIGESAARTIFWRALERSYDPRATEHARLAELSRLDALQRRWWPLALSEDDDVAGRALAQLRWISDTRCRLLGLNAPVQVDAILETRPKVTFEDIERKIKARVEELNAQAEFAVARGA